VPQTSTCLEALFADLRSVERSARARLIEGCAEDDARIERYFQRALSMIRGNAVAALAAAGTGLEGDLAWSLRRETFERMAMGFAHLVSANIDLRARARFKMYVHELCEVETSIAAAIAALRVVPAKRLLPKMFAIQHMAVDDLHYPEPPEHVAEVEAWVQEVHALVRDDIRRRIEAALVRVLAQGTERLGVVKTRIDLALCTARIGAKTSVGGS
jgi:hypothetical protein